MVRKQSYNLQVFKFLWKSINIFWKISILLYSRIITLLQMELNNFVEICKFTFPSNKLQLQMLR